jgi:hypothetical protein
VFPVVDPKAYLRERPAVQVGLAVGVGVLVGLVVWAIVSGGSSSSHKATSSTTDVSATNLRALVGALNRPVYWAGPRHGVTYEFTETSDRRVYLRYLPKGVPAGSTSAYLTVGTYPVANAYAVTVGAARKPGSVMVPVIGGAVAFYAKDRPTNVYVAYRSSPVQIEVYDPSASAARRIVTAGQIRTVTASAAGNTVVTQTGAAATTASALKTLATALGHPIYWLGTLAGTHLELTHSPDGRVYLRYLSAGVKPGSPTPQLAIGTYPVANAFATTKAAAARADSVRIALPHGAIAFYSKARPTNVYVAFPGQNEQVEVYDPSAAYVKKLIAQGKVAPVS